jgi:UDP-glucose 4-epimerase
LRIFLTGVTGFVGAAVAAALLERGHVVIGLARRGANLARLGGFRDNLILVEGALDDEGAIVRAFAAHRPDVVCHSAWQGVFGGVRNDSAQDVNVGFAGRLARIAIEHSVKTVVGLGSQAEYGLLNQAARETDAEKPTTHYGVAKVQARHVMENICRGHARFAWLRIFSLYGPGDNPNWLLPSVIDCLLAGRKPALTGGEQRWDFLHVADAASGIASVIEHTGADGIFNLGSGMAPPLRETLCLLRALVNPSAALGFGEVPYRPDQVMHLQADITRLHEATGWLASITLQEGLGQTIAWHRDRMAGARC